MAWAALVSDLRTCPWLIRSRCNTALYTRGCWTRRAPPAFVDVRSILRRLVGYVLQ